MTWFTIDLAGGCFHVPEEKIVRLKSSVLNVFDSYRVSVHAVASIVGQVVPVSLALDPMLIFILEHCMQTSTVLPLGIHMLPSQMRLKMSSCSGKAM